MVVGWKATARDSIQSIGCMDTLCSSLEYRRPVLRDVVGHRVQVLIREVYRGRDYEIINGHVRLGHALPLLSLPLGVAPRWAM